jgi:hypothetical protein
MGTIGVPTGCIPTGTTNHGSDIDEVNCRPVKPAVAPPRSEPTSKPVKNGDWPQAWGVLQQGHHLAAPNCGQRIPPPAPARCWFLPRQPGGLLDAIGGGGAEPGLGRGYRRRLGLA